MIIPDKCPICKEPMLFNKRYYLYRCLSKDHLLTYHANSKNLNVARCAIHDNLLIMLSIGWHPYDNIIMICKNNKAISIPYFEPDFSNEQEMLNKINIYLTLS